MEMSKKFILKPTKTHKLNIVLILLYNKKKKIILTMQGRNVKNISKYSIF